MTCYAQPPVSAFPAGRTSGSTGRHWGPGPLTPAGWRAFKAARQRGFLFTTDATEDSALTHLRRCRCTAHNQREATVLTRQAVRRWQKRGGSPVLTRVAGAALTLDRTRRVLTPAGLLAVADMLLWAGITGRMTSAGGSSANR